MAHRSLSISSKPGRQFVPLWRQVVQIVILCCIRPSAFKAGVVNRTVQRRCVPLFHNSLLTRRPACIELTFQPMQIHGPMMAGLLTCGSLLPRTFPDVLIQWFMSGSLSAYSCGGSHGIGAKRQSSPCSLFISSSQGIKEPSRRVRTRKRSWSIRNLVSVNLGSFAGRVLARWN